MKKILVIITFIFIFMDVSSSQIDSLYTTENLYEQNDLLKKEIVELKKNYDIQRDIVEGFSHRTSWLEILTAILGGIVGVISIALPLIIYFFQIKPAEKIIEEVKDVDKKVDKQVKKYLEDEKIKGIEKNLEQINNPDELISNNAILYLSMNQLFDFSDKQLFKVYMALKSNLSYNKKSTLAMILAVKETTFADDYFSSLIESGDALFIYHCLKYYTNVGIDKHIEKIIKYILTANEASNNQLIITSNYISIGISLLNHSITAFIYLINNPILNAGLDKDIKKSISGSLETYAKSYGIEKEFKDSLLVI